MNKYYFINFHLGLLILKANTLIELGKRKPINKKNRGGDISK